MKDPFQKRPTAAFVAALGFVLLCLLVSTAMEDQPITTRTATTQEWR